MTRHSAKRHTTAELAEHLRWMAQRERELAEEFDRQAEKFEERAAREANER